MKQEERKPVLKKERPEPEQPAEQPTVIESDSRQASIRKEGSWVEVTDDIDTAEREKEKQDTQAETAEQAADGRPTASLSQWLSGGVNAGSKVHHHAKKKHKKHKQKDSSEKNEKKKKEQQPRAKKPADPTPATEPESDERDLRKLTTEFAKCGLNGCDKSGKRNPQPRITNTGSLIDLLDMEDRDKMESHEKETLEWTARFYHSFLQQVPNSLNCIIYPPESPESLFEHFSSTISSRKLVKLPHNCNCSFFRPTKTLQMTRGT